MNYEHRLNREIKEPITKRLQMKKHTRSGEQQDPHPVKVIKAIELVQGMSDRSATNTVAIELITHASNLRPFQGRCTSLPRLAHGS